MPPIPSMEGSRGPPRARIAMAWIARFVLSGLLLGLGACADTTPVKATGTAKEPLPDSTSGGTTVTPTDASSDPCTSCVTDADCGGGHCVQFDGDWHCAPPCTGGACAGGAICTTAVTAEASSVSVCQPAPGTCAPASGDGLDANATVDVPPPPPCPFDGPDTPSCCTCTGSGCQKNGCYGGWYCGKDACKCKGPTQVPPCALPGGVTPVDVPSGPTITLETLDFAIVGDTRPPSKDGTKLYPTPVIAKIWQEVASEQPPVPFAVTTGDYVFASPYGPEGDKQLDLYLGAQQKFPGKVWHALGNHECTGNTNSNCGPYGKDGMTQLYQAFLDKMVKPMGFGQPYYSVWFQAPDGKWNAKFVFVAANAWDAPQAAWLEAEMARPTTYTFVVRHESSQATEAPGVKPSQAIILNHPFTLLIVGHTHTYQYWEGKREVIVGNGGAPLTALINYGYVIGRLRADGAMQFTAYDYMTHGVFQSFALKPDGTTASIP